MVDRSKADLLADVPIFSPMKGKVLARIAKDAQERRFVLGEKLVSKGEKGIGFYLLMEGTVEIRSEGKVVATLGPSQFFGEMALFDDQPRTADAVATSAGRCLVVSRWEFWGYLANEPEALRILFQETVRRLRTPAQGFTE